MRYFTYNLTRRQTRSLRRVFHFLLFYFAVLLAVVMVILGQGTA